MSFNFSGSIGQATQIVQQGYDIYETLKGRKNH
jgi:hypothetical protein